MVDFERLVSGGIQKLRPYLPGKPIEVLVREMGAREIRLEPANIIKLASNENPLGPSGQVIGAIQQALPKLGLYPDGSGFLLKSDLARHLSILPEQITLGNGSNELLDILARTFLEPGDLALYAQFAFDIYSLVVQAAGAQGIVVKAKDWGHDLEAFALALETLSKPPKMIFLANPNNPTGTWFDLDALTALLEATPLETIVVLDEAYSEYITLPTYPDGLSLLGRYPNLVVTRTFSKAYGLAGLRVGYAVSHPQIAGLLNRVRPPFNVNSLALTAARAALEDEAHLKKSVQLNAHGLRQLEMGLSQLELGFIPSVANFITVDVGREAVPVYEQLLHEGIIVRPLAAYDMPNHLRISVGLEKDNARLLEALQRVLLNT